MMPVSRADTPSNTKDSSSSSLPLHLNQSRRKGHSRVPFPRVLCSRHWRSQSHTSGPAGAGFELSRRRKPASLLPATRQRCQEENEQGDGWELFCCASLLNDGQRIPSSSPCPSPSPVCFRAGGIGSGDGGCGGGHGRTTPVVYVTLVRFLRSVRGSLGEEAFVPVDATMQVESHHDSITQ